MLKKKEERKQIRLSVAKLLQHAATRSKAAVEIYLIKPDVTKCADMQNYTKTNQAFYRNDFICRFSMDAESECFPHLLLLDGLTSSFPDGSR